MYFGLLNYKFIALLREAKCFNFVRNLCWSTTFLLCLAFSLDWWKAEIATLRFSWFLDLSHMEFYMLFGIFKKDFPEQKWLLIEKKYLLFLFLLSRKQDIKIIVDNLLTGNIMMKLLTKLWRMKVMVHEYKVYYYYFKVNNSITWHIMIMLKCMPALLKN